MGEKNEGEEGRTRGNIRRGKTWEEKREGTGEGEGV